MRYFKVEESPFGKYYIVHGTDAFYNYFGAINVSYNICKARIMGLTYASYLRMARDIYNAKLSGKGHKYPTAYFINKSDGEKLAKELDKRLSYIVNNK